MKTKQKLSMIIFWTIMLSALLFAGFKGHSQTNVALGVGVFEQSGIVGNALSLQGEVTHSFTRNFGVTADYSYARLQKGDGRTIYLMGSPILTPDGSTFSQTSLLVNYKVYTNDDRVAVRAGAGASLQQWEDFYPTAQLDIIAFPTANIYPYLSWQPVFRGGFGEGRGWSHTVTLNLALKL